MTARPIDGAEGYRFFRRHDGEVTLDEINEYLRGVGLREVKPRMLVHYRKLERHGYSSYLTQNRLDLAVAGDAGWLEELQARYAEVDETTPVELRWEDNVATGSAESLGLTSATVLVLQVPPAGRAVVLRLRVSGIERTATVVRSDPDSGRVHLKFDVYGGIKLAPSDAPYLTRFTVALPDAAESMPAISDVLFRLERAVARAQGESDELPRVHSMSMSSPLDVVLQSSSPMTIAIGLLLAVPIVRKQWYDSRKSKLEGDGIELDNEAKRRALQLEVDRELGEKADQLANDDGDDPLVDDLREAGAEAAFGELSRREFFSAVAAALALPMEMSIESAGRDDFEGREGEAGT